MFINQLIKIAKDNSFNFDFSGLQPFIIDSALTNPFNIQEINNSHVLSTPFKTWSFEFSDGVINYAPGLQDSKKDLFCVVVKEITPIEYHFIILAADNGEYFLAHLHKDSDKEGFNTYQYIKAFTNFVLEKINSQKSGLISTRIREKYKFKKENHFYKCKNVIYISSNSEKKYLDEGSQFPINWHHSWRVRGHWRRLDKLESLGCDRNGERIIKGFTWINPYLKGDGKELIKVRKITKNVVNEV